MKISDIARMTGFSAMTVSRAINEPDKVSPKTRDTIMRIIDEVGYRPNPAAQSLASNRTNIIYVYIPSDLGVDHPFVMQVVTAIGERLGENGYSFYLSRKPHETESCDGVIAMGLTLEEEAHLSDREAGRPFVFFGNSETLTNWVDVDNYGGSRLITQYMLDKGYQKIAYIGVNQAKRYAEDRYNAFKDVMQASSRDCFAIERVDNKENCGYEATMRLLTNGTPDAILCASDLLAIGCIRALRSRKLRVPDDLAVAGFDGLGYETLTYPHITTVAQPIYEVGIRLADVMLDMLKKNIVPEKGIYIQPRLIYNESA